MKNLKNNPFKKQLLTVYAIGVAVMLLIAYVATPYAIIRVGCAIDDSLLTCITYEPKILFLLFMMPTVLVLIAIFTLFTNEKPAEIAALSSNKPRVLRMNIMMTIFFIVGSLLMFTVSYLPKSVVKDNVDLFKSGWYALTTVLMLYASNMAGKMNKSLFAGWPTPWNQKSELAWEKSQRFIGFALTIVCIVGFIVAFIWVDLFLYIFISGMALAYAGCAVVSFYVYKTELNLKAQSVESDS